MKMIVNKVIIVLIFILIQYKLQSQCNNCVLSTQVQVDNFAINFGNCSSFGDIKIEGSDIVNLNGLSYLTSLNGNLLIQNTSLLNFVGLENLISIGGDFRIRFNDILDNINSLSSLSQVGGDMEIFHNDLLDDISGITYLPLNNPSCNFLLSGNKLSSIPSFPNVVKLKALFIAQNSSLLEINGFSNLESLDYTGVSYAFIIMLNPQLESVVGFQSLNFIADVTGIMQNPKLKYVHGFNSLINLENGITISNNNTLEDISFFENIIYNNETNWQIKNNPMLSNCNYNALCPYSISNYVSSSNIVNNACGCNSKSEIALDCANQNPCGDEEIECDLAADFNLRVSNDFQLSISGNQLSVSHNALASTDSWFPIWGDNTSGGAGYQWGPGTYNSTHTYAQPGSYDICITIENYPSEQDNTTEKCHCKILCKTININ